MKRTLFTSALCLTIASMGFTQSDFDTAKLDAYFHALEANNKFMGSIAVAKDGAILYTRSLGYADVAKELKADEQTTYRIGSITKSFTAVLVMKALEAEKLSLNQTIDKWFPTMENAHQITIKQLLSHRSGIHNFTNNEDYLSWNTKAHSEQEMLDIISQSGSDFTPDSKADYSNSNYVLLTYILEKTFGKSYADLLQEQIVQPLELTNTYVFGSSQTHQGEAKSYQYLGHWEEVSATHYTVPLGAGAISATPVDLCKFADALFSGKLVSGKSLELMKTMREAYGLGLFQVPFYEHKGYGHTGGIDGFTSVYTHFEDGNISYALTSNGTNINNNDISIAVLSAVYGKPYELPDFRAISLSPEELKPYLGVYASTQMPLKITISQDQNTLIAQATGQSAFPLEATEKDIFEFEPAGIVLEFHPEEKTMVLKQGGGQFTFTKE